MFALLIPALLSFLLLAAHFFRGEHLTPMLVACATPSLLLLRRNWATRLVQVMLVIGALEWVRTMLAIRAIRIDEGREWGRMAGILAGVGAFTFLSALVLLLPPIHRHYCRSGTVRTPATTPLDKHFT